jgi:hypothetical protein
LAQTVVLIGGQQFVAVYACRYAPLDRIGRSAMTDYLVVYEQADDGGWGAQSPDVSKTAANRTRPIESWLQRP